MYVKNIAFQDAFKEDVSSVLLPTGRLSKSTWQDIVPECIYVNYLSL